MSRLDGHYCDELPDIEFGVDPVVALSSLVEGRLSDLGLAACYAKADMDIADLTGCIDAFER